MNAFTQPIRPSVMAKARAPVLVGSPMSKRRQITITNQAQGRKEADERRAKAMAKI